MTKKVTVIVEADLDNQTVNVSDDHKVGSMFLLASQAITIQPTSLRNLIFRKSKNSNFPMFCTGYQYVDDWYGDRPDDGVWLNPFENNQKYQRTGEVDTLYVENLTVTSVELQTNISDRPNPSNLTFDVRFSDGYSTTGYLNQSDLPSSVAEYNSRIANTQGTVTHSNGSSYKFTYPTITPQNLVITANVEKRSQYGRGDDLVVVNISTVPSISGSLGDLSVTATFSGEVPTDNPTNNPDTTYFSKTETYSKQESVYNGSEITIDSKVYNGVWGSAWVDQNRSNSVDKVELSFTPSINWWWGNVVFNK